MTIFNEGAEFGDLARLVQPALTIDEFRSKMGDDKDIVVVGLTVFGKEPADDLVNFIEKSYDWVLDADISSGETSDGNYMVFVELQRNKDAPKHTLSMITDLLNLTKQKISEWEFTYYKNPAVLPLTKENLEKTVITSPEEYGIKSDSTLGESAMFNSLRSLSGIRVTPSKITDKHILSIQRAAGIK
jgi:hypothetical protein